MNAMTDTVHFNIFYSAQGTDQWKIDRAGVITASMFKTARERVGTLSEQQQVLVDAIRSGMSHAEAAAKAEYKTKPKLTDSVQRAIEGLPVGDFSEAAKNYAFRLAIERISLQPLDEGFETWAMKRGHELEPEARARHEAHANLSVMPCGLVTTSDNAFGASADGLIEPDGGAEYKCLVDPLRLRTCLIDNDISDFMDQVQGGLWITGRRWWDLCIYCPALASIGRDFTRWRVPRDDDYINTMEAELLEFKRLVDLNETILRGQTTEIAA